MSLLRQSFWALCLGFLCCGLLCSRPVQAAEPPANQERIHSYHSDVNVHADGSMTVTETITVTALGQQIKRGIYRDFPTSYVDRFNHAYNVQFEISTVYRDGVGEDYHTERLSNGVRVYIGNKDYLLPSGRYTYELTYKTNRQLGFFDDHDELYWNVTGNGWEFPIDQASASITLPFDLTQQEIGLFGYTGPTGSKDTNYSARIAGSNRVEFFTTSALGAKEGLTVAVTWPKGLIAEPTQAEKMGWFLRDNRGTLLGIVFYIAALISYYVSWNRVGRDPEKGTIIPEYEPPQGLSPAAVRFIMRMGFDKKAFTATILNTAVKGHVAIEENKKKFTLERNPDRKREALTARETKVLDMLFRSHKKVELDNSNHKKIQSAIDVLKEGLAREYEKVYFLTNSKFMIVPIIISLIGIAAASLFNPTQGPGMLVGVLFIALWLTMWSFGTFALIAGVAGQWHGGFLQKTQAMIMSIVVVPFVAGECMGLYMLYQATSLSFCLLLLAFAVTHFVFYQLLKAPTLIGRKIMDHIEGFKMYLGTAEKDRLELLHAPERTPELFERFLPYALALDVENQWAEQFSNVLTSTTEGQQGYHPSFYRGTHFNNFSATNFTSTMGSSFSNAISSASTPPGSSSGGGGGGSSGGGGGGGGGGGW